MIRIGLRIDSDQIKRILDGVAKDQVPFATAKALTGTAQLVKKALITEMSSAFDRPTPYTLRSLFLSPAKKTKLEARVWLKDDAGKGTPATKYLLPQIEGGGRRHKRFERALAAVGLLPQGMYVMPGEAAKLDAYGNMARGQVVQILSALKAAETYSGHTANRTERSAKRKGRRLAEYFVGKPSNAGMPTGIWQRFGFAYGSAVKPVAIFTRQPQYRVRYKFYDIAEQVIRDEFPLQFREAAATAMATAR